MSKPIEKNAPHYPPLLACKQLGWTYEKFCEVLNITREELFSWTEGRYPTTEQRAKIYDLLQEQDKKFE